MLSPHLYLAQLLIRNRQWEKGSGAKGERAIMGFPNFGDYPISAILPVLPIRMRGRGWPGETPAFTIENGGKSAAPIRGADVRGHGRRLICRGALPARLQREVREPARAQLQGPSHARRGG